MDTITSMKSHQLLRQSFDPCGNNQFTKAMLAIFSKLATNASRLRPRSHIRGADVAIGDGMPLSHAWP
jgi:hypothetical protein